MINSHEQRSSFSSHRTDARMIGKHETGHTMATLNVWATPRQRHLNTGRTPWNELRQLTFTNTL